MLTEERVRELLWDEYSRAGTMRALAERAGVTVAYVHDALNGRRAPGPAFLSLLGIEKVVRYRKIKEQR
jgi:transcriptional regulator with XRE-family HTH domain